MKTKSTTILILILSLIALASIAWLSTFTRLYADDFCIGADAQQMNLLSYFQKWYSTWTGRFSYLALAGVLSQGGAHLAAILPALSLIIWLIALSFAIAPIVRNYGAEKPLLPALTVGAVILFILFKTTPNLFQSFFWRDGIINYTFPLIGLTIVTCILVRSWLEVKNSGSRAVLVFLISFISGGFSEVFSVMQVSLMASLILIVLTTGQPRNRRVFLNVVIAALAGSLLALLVVLVAPGNAVRQSLLAAHPNLLRLITFSVRNALFIAAKFFIQTPGWAILTLITAIWAGLNVFPARSQFAAISRPRSHGLGNLVLLGATTFLIMIAACAPVVYMLNAYPDDRTILLPLFVLIIGLMTGAIMLSRIAVQYGWFNSILKKPSFNRWLTVAVLMAVLIATAIQLSSTILALPNYRNYAAAWEERDLELRRQAEQHAQQVSVAGLDSRFGLSDLRVEADFWVNRCMADYYQTPEIIGK